jgi:hypothetical protein
VSVEYDRIGALDPGDEVPVGRSKCSHGAVGPVDVEPQTMLGRVVCERLERIERPRRGRARASHDGENPPTRVLGAAVRLAKAGGIEAEPVIDGDGYDAASAESQDPRGTVVRVMRLFGREDRERLVAGEPVVPRVYADDRLAGRGECGQVARRAARREEPLDIGAEAERRPQPFEQTLLHRVRDWTHLELRGAVVEDGRDELR